MILIKKAILTNLVSLNLFFASNNSTQLKINSRFCIDEIHLIENGCSFGQITCLKLFPFALLYDFFVKPEFRSKGYGKTILEFTCSRLNSYLIFIQPGPFEVVNGKYLNVQDSNKLKRLVNLYKTQGFKAAPKILSILAIPIYKMFKLKEDPKFLMYR